jgi:hypothetical protein
MGGKADPKGFDHFRAGEPVIGMVLIAAAAASSLYQPGYGFGYR